MADVIGPTSRLPGHRWPLPAGTMCDEHEDVPAVARVQGETDSFGAELNDLCQECLDAFENSDPTEGYCDICRKEAHLSPCRDAGEGTHGPVYHVCIACSVNLREA